MQRGQDLHGRMIVVMEADEEMEPDVLGQSGRNFGFDNLLF